MFLFHILHIVLLGVLIFLKCASYIGIKFVGFFQGERAKIWTFTGPKIKLSTKADLKGDNAVLTIKEFCTKKLI